MNELATSIPLVSVVMSVFNGAVRLESTLESVLSQEGVELELVVVDDGSTDGTGAILRRYAERDSRVRLVQQENEGLTRALIKGCGLARGHYIARQDAGDRSLPGRLARQAAYLQSHPHTALVSCWTRYLGPADEELWIDRRTDSPVEATLRLRADRRKSLRGISSHSSAMFRRADYFRVGGYRPQFRLAQDLDLWMRLTDIGQVAFVPECLCEYRYDPDSLSGRHAREQAELTDMIIALRKRRQAGLDEGALLERAGSLHPSSGVSAPRLRAGGWYFLGKVLTDRGDRRGLAYLRQAARIDPLFAGAWFWWLWRRLVSCPVADRGGAHAHV